MLKLLSSTPAPSSTSATISIVVIVLENPAVLAIPKQHQSGRQHEPVGAQRQVWVTRFGRNIARPAPP